MILLPYILNADKIHHLTVDEMIKSLLPCRFIYYVDAHVILKGKKQMNSINCTYWTCAAVSDM